ncbi:MAG: hypothetical protein WKF88_04925 [Ferruginibacter sp.]
MKIQIKPYSATALALTGLLLAGMGLYFIYIRPALLGEDLKYMGTTFQNVQENMPGLFKRLQKVFWVMGGYIFSTGLLIIFISFTSFRYRQPGAFIIPALAGITSIGLMTAVNFMISSDFKCNL